MSWLWWWLRHATGAEAVQPGRCLLAGLVTTQAVLGGAVESTLRLEGALASVSRLEGAVEVLA
jgi:hypothetical protein